MFLNIFIKTSGNWGDNFMKLEPCFLIFVRWLPREMKQEMARLICCDKLLCLADNSRKEISGRVGTKTEAAKSRKVLEWGEEAKSCQIHILRLICPRYSETKRCFCTWTFFLPGKKTPQIFFGHICSDLSAKSTIFCIFSGFQKASPNVVFVTRC